MKIRPDQILLDPLYRERPAPAEPREARDRYYVSFDDQQAPVLRKFNPLARMLDANDDGVIDSEEILDPEADLAPIQLDHEDFTFGLKLHLAGLASPYASAYPSCAQVSQRLEELEAAYPDLAQRVPLGTTQEGRTIWALRVGRGPEGEKPAALVTGGHHAREWAPVGAVMDAAEELLANYESDPKAAQRVNGLESWFVPLANPDGYEYARLADPDWRKNRTPLEGSEVGVDLNRNYQAHYRIFGDAPDSTADDIGASDNPANLTYRGPHAASERETQVLTDFIDTHANLRGLLDTHAFGRLILFPESSPERDARYREAAAHLQEAMQVPYTAMSIPELYPTTGDITSYAESRGMLSMGLEIGRAFQPAPEKAAGVRSEGVKGIHQFLDEVLIDCQPPEPPQQGAG